jgi:hypothetical protein
MKIVKAAAISLAQRSRATSRSQLSTPQPPNPALREFTAGILELFAGGSVVDRLTHCRPIYRNLAAMVLNAQEVAKRCDAIDAHLRDIVGKSHTMDSSINQCLVLSVILAICRRTSPSPARPTTGKTVSTELIDESDNPVNLTVECR